MTQELSEMDKKNFSCLTSPPSKSLTQQEPSSRSSRQGQDAPACGQAARKPPQPRRRESPLGGVPGSSARVDSAPKKTNPQKNKGPDKRPKPRLNTNARQTEENESDLAYLPTTAGRKQNANHLINFHFAPREGRNLWRSFNTHPGSSASSRSHSTHSAGSRPKFNKENFLQANCQFLVKGGEDYSVYECDPDILVNWNLIEQIKICITGENPSCPICLDSPVGAKMTRCGHIFCWPCILHYLALTDKDARVCPICYDSELISATDLKSVIVKLYPDVDAGDEIAIQLMVRAKDSMHAYPLSTKPGVPLSLEDSYSKLVSATPIEVMEYVLERERSELIVRLKEDEHCPEVCFIQQALNHLSARRNAILSELTALDPMQAHIALLKKPMVPIIPEAGTTAGQARSMSGETASSIGDKDAFACKSVEIDGFSYFYQAENGQNIFLHPLNMAMLWRNYGPDPATWPQVIRVKIIEKESKTMCVDERLRYRFLRHLPVTTCFHIIEADLTELMISDEILHEFEERLALREKRRADKIREEKRREEAFEAEERKKNAPKPAPKIESKIDFPTWADEEYEGLQYALLSSLAESSLENVEDDKASENSTREDEKSVFNSQRPPLKDREWRSLDSNYPGLPSEGASAPSSQSHLSFARVAANPCTGKSPSSQPTLKPVQVSPAKPERDAESEEYSAPNFRASVSDAIAKAFATHDSYDKEAAGENSNKGQKKKGRRGKGKVLFATGVGSFGSN